MIDLMDITTPTEARSRIMRSVKQKNTAPEIMVRSCLHRLGFRFRINRRDLPGSPDIVLPKWKAVIFVHGCFWHRHKDCSRTTTPKTNTEFWMRKFQANVLRDQRKFVELNLLGWKTAVIWECDVLKSTEAATITALKDLGINSQDDFCQARL